MKNGKKISLTLGVLIQHLSRIEHAQKRITKTTARIIHSMYIVYAHEGLHMCNKTFDHIIDQRSDSGPSLRIELTLSDRLMEDRAESVA